MPIGGAYNQIRPPPFPTDVWDLIALPTLYLSLPLPLLSYFVCTILKYLIYKNINTRFIFFSFTKGQLYPRAKIWSVLYSAVAQPAQAPRRPSADRH